MVGFRRLKDVHASLGEIQKTCVLANNNIYEQWLVVTASGEDLAGVFFASTKFMSSCVICLVIAREIFLL